MIWRASIALAAIGLVPCACEADAPMAASPVDAGSALAKLTYPARMDAVATD